MNLFILKLSKFLLVAFLFCLISTSLQAQHIFKINDFAASEHTLMKVGQSQLLSDRLRLTTTKHHQQGACWYKEQKIDLSKGFNTEFTFQINQNDDRFKGGDGFAFVIQNQSADAIGGSGDRLGYKEIPFAVAIEFDTYNNKEGSKNHICVAIYEPATKSYRKYATVHEIPEINDGEVHFARVEYKNERLTFYLDSYLFPVVSSKLNLSDLIQSDDHSAWLGFTSSTSHAFANHDLLQWSLQAYPDEPQIDEKNIEVSAVRTLEVSSRKLSISVWDNNKEDGDIISLKAGEEWLLSNYKIKKTPKTIEYTLTGFESQLVLFANNTGTIPPNTAAFKIDDGTNIETITLEADLNYSQAINIRFKAQ